MPESIYTQAEIDERLKSITDITADLHGWLLGQEARLDALTERVIALEGAEPEPEPEPQPGDKPAFMARPLHEPFNVSGGTDVVIEDFSFRGGTVEKPSGQAIRLYRVKRALIRNCDFENLIGAINIVECEDVVVEDCRGRNIGITGLIGNGRGNYVQFNTSIGGAVRRCRFLGGQTEDMISTWRSGGRSPDDPLVVEDNHLEGVIADTPLVRAWTSSSGTGVIVGDGAGHPNNGNMVVRRNILVNVGQIGVQHIDGDNLITEENIIIADRYSRNNQPWASWGDGTPRGVVRNNRYHFIGPDGSQRSGWFQHSTMRAENNVRDTSLRSTDYHIVL